MMTTKITMVTMYASHSAYHVIPGGASQLRVRDLLHDHHARHDHQDQNVHHVIPCGASQLRVRDLGHKDRSRDQVAASAVTRRKPFRECEELFHV